MEEFKNYIEAKGLTFLPISAATRQGVDNLPALVYNRLKDLPPVKVYEAEYKRPDKNAQPTRPFTVERTGDHEFTVCSTSRHSWVTPAFWTSWSPRALRKRTRSRSASMNSIICTK